MSSNQNTRRARHLARLARVLVFGGVAAVGFASMADAAPAGVKAQVKRNVLTVTGTSGADNIRIRLKPFDATKLEVDVGGNGTADFTFNRSQFTKIEVLGAGGDDTIVADHINGAFTDTEETTFDGGPGNDTLSGSVANERLIGGTGNDTVDGDLGADTVMLGDGTDTFLWVFGDASDVVTGGPGTDTMSFTGANIGETFDVSANGGKVRLARNVGTVVMDIDDLEIIQLNAMSGPDVINVGNLASTDLTTLETNLGGLGGADDTSADSINVPLNAAIGRDGSTPVANELGAQVRVSFPGQLDEFHVTGAGASDTFTLMGTSGADTFAASAYGTDAVIDGATPGMFIHLTGIETTDVQLGAGNDTFTAVGNLAAITSLRVDGGNDNDTLLGSNGADQLIGGNGNDFLDGQQGIDAIAMGDGDDTFQWDPGDANDSAIDGGTGTDAMTFNGSGANEIFDVRANGNQVRFSRNIANILFDFDNIEALNLSTGFGSDIVLVQNLTGTDLTTFTPNMAGFAASDDAVVDTIEVPVGVTIGRDGTTPVVNGLGAQVRVANPFPLDEIHVTGPSTNDAVTIAGTDGPDTIQVAPAASDVYVDGATPGIFVRLTGIESTDVALAAGNDTFGAVGNLAPLTTLRVDGGNDGDILLGGNGPDQLVGGQGDDFIDGNQGTDTIAMGDGTDTFQWDPGDGSDTVDGGAGLDKLSFNGSAGDEIFGLGANGGTARFTRNLGSITMDLDNVENVSIKALGGADALNVSNLT
ncbi:MAG TPA: calcium-binding protein, partial [Ilumatobacteraceae bacterium]|nr:calcium-binding protein [Ilumatobacteraceae bacterium]